MTRRQGLATDGSNNEGDKFLPVLVRHVDKDSGMSVTSLLNIPNIDGGSPVEQMYNVCSKVREALSLNLDNCVTYSPDDTNSYD